MLRIFDAIRGYGSPRVTLDRAVCFTESFKATEGQLLVLRWARALKHVAENIQVTIFDDELLVGRPNTWLGRYGLVYGELDGSLLKAAVEAAEKQVGQKGAVVITAEEQAIHAELARYCARERATVSLSPEQGAPLLERVRSGHAS